jgi:hypothetical protein
MLAALVAISILGNGVGLIIHYGLTGDSVVRATPTAHDLTTNSAALSHIEKSTRGVQHDKSTSAASGRS